MTYTAIGVKLVVMARYGARFIVLQPPFSSDWLRRLNFGSGTKISPRHVILYKPALFSLSPRNSRIISYSLRADARSPQHKVTVKLHCEHGTVTSISRNVKLQKLWAHNLRPSAPSIL